MELLDQTNEELALMLATGEPPGAQAVFSELYQRLSATLFRVVKCWLQGDINLAHDICQQAWLNAFASATAYDGKSPYQARLMFIAKNLVRDHHKRASTRLNRSLEEDTLSSRQQYQIDSMIDQEQKLALKACLDSLADQEAEVIRLRLGGTSYPDVCDHLGIDVKSAYRYFDRGKKNLTDCMSGKNT